MLVNLLLDTLCCILQGHAANKEATVDGNRFSNILSAVPYISTVVASSMDNFDSRLVGIIKKKS